MEQTVYYRHPGGAVSAEVIIVGEGGELPPPPEGAVEITRAEYEAEIAAIEAARLERERQQAAEEKARQEADYQALLAAGIPEETARRLSGYTPGPGPEEALGQR